MHSAASDLGVHCLLRPGCPNTLSKYRNLIKSNTLRNHLGSTPDLKKKKNAAFDYSYMNISTFILLHYLYIENIIIIKIPRKCNSHKATFPLPRMKKPCACSGNVT